MQQMRTETRWIQFGSGTVRKNAILDSVFHFLRKGNHNKLNEKMPQQRSILDVNVI